MPKASFPRLRGFRDFPPDDLRFRNHIFEAWRRVSRRYGFQEYDGPPLEALDLYVEKSGPEIVGQLYSFQDKGERDVALRPDMTPSLARILGERSRSMAKPIRWFSMPQLFRYERQQRGRLREHFQWNVDVVGEEDVAADVEVVAVAIDGLRELGLTHEDFRARVSDRRLLAGLLRALGVDDDRLGAAFAVVDKMERARDDETSERLRNEIGLDAEQASQVLDVFGGATLDDLAELFGKHEDVATEVARLQTYFGCLEAMGLGAYVEFDLSVVRGLAYYTGIVFELFDTRRELRAICGGGRYDRLLELVGGAPQPAVGFGMGDVVLGELLKDRQLGPDPENDIDYFIVCVSPEQKELALSIAHAQRDRGRSVVYALREQAVGKQFKAAGSLGAREVIVLGPEEVARDCAVIRVMESGEEREVSLEELR